MYKDIAVIGMAGRFPDADNLDQLVENLKNGKDSIGGISPKRLKDTTLDPDRDYKACGYLEDIDKFDFNYFQISPAEARDMGPEQRLLLEVIHEAIDNAGVNIDQLSGTNTAVFVSDIQTGYYQHADEFSETLLIGNSPDYLAAKIARQFNMQGSATTINTSCSSSMVGVYFACNELMLENCESALVCGVNLNLFPYKGTEGLDLESPDGRSMAFSANANGMSFGEMVAAVWLKPLARAIEDKDIIHAVIKGIAVNNNGNRSFSLTAPDSLMQAKLIREAWRKARTDPVDIGYIEAHGSGTALGDSLEVEGLNMAFEGYRDKKNFSPVPISTIKSNLGHGRAASGLCGLIKTVLSLKLRILFPTIHFDEPNPLIDFEHSAVYVNKELKEWETKDGKTRYAGVSTLGASGINCHAVLAEMPAAQSIAAPGDDTDNEGCYLITLSSRSAHGLMRNIKALKQDLDRNRQYRLPDISYTLNKGRKHHEYRFASVSGNLDILEHQLEKTADTPGIFNSPPPPLERLIFIFSDNQEIPPGLLNHMLSRHNIFHQNFEQCRVLCPVHRHNDNRFQSFAFQYGYYRLLESYGVVTNNVLGIGIGRIIHQVITGDITLDDGLGQVFSYKNEKIENLETRVDGLIQRETNDGPVAFIEMGPSGILAKELKKQQPRSQNGCFYVFGLLDENPDIEQDPLPVLVKSLYLAHYDINWEQFCRYHKGRRIELPGYCFEKTRCWLREEPRPPVEKQAGSTDEEPVPLLKEEGSEIEEKIARSWTDVLEVKQYSLDDDFFEIGGDSLKTTEVINRVNSEFGLRLSFEDMFDFPTIRQLGQYIAELWGTEQRMAVIWKEVLKYDEIKPEDNFFRLGGHSLMANQVLNKIKKVFHLELDFEDIFKFPTLKSFSLYVDDRLTAKVDKLESREINIPITPKKEYYALSSAQKRMYLMQQIEPESTSYNTRQIFQTDLQLDRSQIKNAINELIRRHETLRTSFEIVDHQPVQRIHPAGEIDFAIRYMEADTSDINDSISHFIRPFDLSIAPLVRIGIIKMAESGYLVIFDQHHIITDGASFRIFLRELKTLYEGGSLPPLPIQYKDFSEWQNRLFQSEKIKKQEDYWVEKFKDNIPQLDFPLDFPRSEGQSREGEDVHFQIGKTLTRKIRAFAFETGTTINIFLLAVYNILLSKFRSQEDIVIGLGVSGRRHDDLENVIGMFVNMMVIRNFPRGDKTFIQFLQDVKKNFLESYENQDYPFDELVTRLEIKRRVGRNPLFDAEYIFEPLEFDEVKLQGLTLKPYRYGIRNIQFDLSLIGMEARGTINMSLSFPYSLFKRETIEKMTAYYIEIIEQVIIDETILLNDIKIHHELSLSKSNLSRNEFTGFDF
ncbi:MAG: hypothetical protein GY940_15710 [bacterium]|nr:hypothetical protein [bacterium]